MTARYSEFLATKVPSVIPAGIPYEHQGPIGKHPFPWQRELIRWSLHLGRAALFEDCGLGKSIQELEWARAIHEHSDRNVLGLAPLAVAGQLVEEGRRFGIEVNYARDQSEVKPGVNVTNYERLEKFDADSFEGVFLDESSILKSYMGRTKRALIEKFARTRFKLCGTATPSPNDVMELGNHCEFLGVMDSHEMLTRWFINDTMAAGHYRLKGHAEDDFWRWVASWAACVSKPSDVVGASGESFSDEGYELPGLEVMEHVVNAGGIAKKGELFHDGKLTATTMHQEMRQTAGARAALAAELVRSEPTEDWLIWCNTNYEADELVKLIPDAVEVRGDDSLDHKEAAALWFAGARECLCQAKSRSETTTRLITPSDTPTQSGDRRRSPLQPSTTDAIPQLEKNTCGNTTASISVDRKSLPEGTNKKVSETQVGETDTKPTNNSGSRKSQKSQSGPVNTQRRGSRRTSGSSDSPSQNTAHSSSANPDAAPSADATRTGTTTASSGCTSTTATQPGEFAACSVPPAISGSENLVTIPSGWNEQRCTCGRRNQRRKVLISKSGIFGYGMNFQRSARSAFVGLSFSFEDLYQALRRQYRFGQKRTVQAHIICARSEQGIRSVVARKQEEHARMQERMVKASRASRHLARTADSYSPSIPMRLPSWVREARAA